MEFGESTVDKYTHMGIQEKAQFSVRVIFEAILFELFPVAHAVFTSNPKMEPILPNEIGSANWLD
jgi:hypothetical protein